MDSAQKDLGLHSLSKGLLKHLIRRKTDNNRNLLAVDLMKSK